MKVHAGLTSFWPRYLALLVIASGLMTDYFFMFDAIARVLPVTVVYWLPHVVVWAITFIVVYRSQPESRRDTTFRVKLAVLPLVAVVFAVVAGFLFAYLIAGLTAEGHALPRSSQQKSLEKQRVSGPYVGGVVATPSLTDVFGVMVAHG
jgi:hypothetical protein